MARTHSERLLIAEAKVKTLETKLKSLKSKHELGKIAAERKQIEHILRKKKRTGKAREFMVWVRLTTTGFRGKTVTKEIKNGYMPSPVPDPWLYEKPIRVIEKWAFDNLYDETLK